MRTTVTNMVCAHPAHSSSPRASNAFIAAFAAAAAARDGRAAGGRRVGGRLQHGAVGAGGVVRGEEDERAHR